MRIEVDEDGDVLYFRLDETPNTESEDELRIEAKENQWILAENPLLPSRVGTR